MRNRSLSRRLALQFLYQLYIRGDEILPELTDFLQAESSKDDVRNYARLLIEGVCQQRDAIDRQIADVAHNWKLERMACIDLTILRVAIFELLQGPEVPPVVVINEAIELAKLFSTEKSSAFVNGILDKIKAQVGRPAPATDLRGDAPE